MSRRLPTALGVLLGVVTVIAVQLGPNRDRIEDDLTRRATVALAAAGQPDAHVTFTGRDGLIVTSASASARAHDVVAAIDGVREVRTRVVVTQAVPARMPPRMRAVAGRVRAAVAGSVEAALLRRELAAVPPLTFRTGGAELSPASRAALRRAAVLLGSRPDARIRVEGHTDSRGTEQANLALSRDRAEAVRAALVEYGIPAGRMTVAGHGEARPRAVGDTASHCAANRRVELAVR
ncbi:OmpA family protein [Actinoplanes sp. NPDC023801]|uniref:OmpA family protein n=1 Tax=Actinoplanes sp. NPDC023801 TaxID=3154595 RepID=UPI0033EC862D